MDKSKQCKSTHKSSESKLICNKFFPFKARLPRLDAVKSRNDGVDLAVCRRKTRNDEVDLAIHKGKTRNDGGDSSLCSASIRMTKKATDKFLPNTTIIALGANLKRPIHTFITLFLKLKQNAHIDIIATSPIYKNPPFGFCNQPFFYNATMLLATSMCLLEFYAFIFYMERIFGRGRIRAFKNAPRTLDIDIIFFNDIIMQSTKLNIPHPQWQNRASVLIPLIYQVNYRG